MHPKIYEEFERICSKRKITGSVLEVGATPSSKSLLRMKSLVNVTEKVGINLDGPHELEDYKIHKGNANSMDMFDDEQFDAVFCNAMLEHDKFFWKTLSEIRRVTKPNGFIAIGTPGYKDYKVEKYRLILDKIPYLRRLRFNQYMNLFFTSTITFQIHDYPGDYYRFSPQTYKEVFFEGMDDVEINALMLPPRIVGSGIKKPN